jgi:hypothetical protein
VKMLDGSGSIIGKIISNEEHREIIEVV